MNIDYRSVAEKDALEFSHFLRDEDFDLYTRGYPSFSFFIMSNGRIKKFSPDSVTYPDTLLHHLRDAGLTGFVVISVLPKEGGAQLGIEIQVDDSKFYPLPPNPVSSSYSSIGYMRADGNIVIIPREPHPGRYYFPNLISWEKLK